MASWYKWLFRITTGMDTLLARSSISCPLHTTFVGQAMQCFWKVKSFGQHLTKRSFTLVSHSGRFQSTTRLIFLWYSHKYFPARFSHSNEFQFGKLWGQRRCQEGKTLKLKSTASDTSRSYMCVFHWNCPWICKRQEMLVIRTVPVVHCTRCSNHLPSSNECCNIPCRGCCNWNDTKPTEVKTPSRNAILYSLKNTCCIFRVNLHGKKPMF